MKTKVFKTISFLLAAVMFFSLCGCAETTPALGTFECIKAEYQDYSATPQTLYEGGAVLELNENGKGFFHLGNDTGAVSWQLERDKLSLQFDKQVYTGSYEDGRITVEIQGVHLEFAEASNAPVVIDGSAQSESYYGWWNIGDAGGQWKDYSGMWFDSCAVIELDENGDEYFVMWDEDSSYEEPICRIEVEADEGGSLRVVKGAFIDCEITESNWRFNTENTGFSDMMVVELAYSDKNGTFNSVMYFRPWGVIWDDVHQEAPDLMPYYYEDWYLPLVEAGSHMPREFEIK